MPTFPELVAEDTSPFLDITFPANINGHGDIVVTYRIDAGELRTLPEGQVEVIDTGAVDDGDGVAVLRLTWEEGDLTPGLMFIDAEVTLSGGRKQHLAEPVVAGIRSKLSTLTGISE